MIVKLLCLAILATSAFSASADQHAFDSCSPTEFSCGDGTCVSADLVCDGVTHCASGEDELSCDRGMINLSSDDPVPSRPRRETSTLSRLQNETCTLPEYPTHGTYTTNIPNAGPGESHEQVNISITCGYGFVADNSPSVTCLKGLWQKEMPKCVLCGKVTSSATPLIAGGVSAKHGMVPWHAGIYKKDTNPYRQICGGSLISTDIVLSAAHCFWTDSLGGGTKQPAVNFAVAVGKLYRPWNNDMDTEAQKSDVKEIHLPAHFLGDEAHYQHDIAVVVVSTPFMYETFIRPVCVDFDIHFEDGQLQPGNKGMVAGWGLTAETSTVSQVLKVIELPFVSTATCISQSPLQYRGYISGDKICAGFIDEGKAVCKGDSGGGLAFPELDNDTTRFFLRGIVSTAPTTDSLASLCNVNTYMTFTQIRWHADIIMEFWVPAGIRSADDGGKMKQKETCTLPPYPAHGTYVVTNAPAARPGRPLDFAVINVACDVGYKVNGSSSGLCFNGTWQGQFPTCVGSVGRVVGDTPPCKEETLARNSYSPFYSLDNVSLLPSGTLRRDSAGRRAYIELHLALQAEAYVRIYLTEKEDLYSGINYALWVGVQKRTRLWNNDAIVESISTPDILSATEFRSFYIKVDDGKLQFGKEGDAPLISHPVEIGLLNYYRFGIWYGSVKIRYCPAAV